MRACSFAALGGAAAAVGLLASAEARVTRIVIDDRQPLAAAPGQTIAYEQISGRAFGLLEPGHARNRIIQDIELARDSRGQVGYTASFVITRPVDLAQASGLMWHDVPNRGTPYTILPLERRFGDI